MNRIAIRSLALAAMLVAAPAFADGPAPSELASTSWQLVALGDAPSAQGVTTTLDFDKDNGVSGNGGCNRFFGSAEVKDASLKFSKMGSTMMACEEPKMKQEQAFHAALGDTASFRIENGELVLADAGGKSIARLTRP